MDALLITGLENIRYLSGFTGSNAVLLVMKKESYFFTDSRYETQAGEEVKNLSIICGRKLLESVSAWAVKGGVKRLGFEGEKVSYDEFLRLRDGLNGCELRSLSRELGTIRSAKEQREIALMRKAIAIGDRGFACAAEMIAPGVAEKDIARHIEGEIRRWGADAAAFDIIVASGARAALPHGIASDKKIERGDFVIVDLGVSFRGYNSDETRTFVVGKASRRQEGVYQIVKEGHDRAIGAVKAGVRASDVDNAARGYIQKRRMGKYFEHGTGHGVGIAVHEPPTVSPNSSDVLEKGMVITIEPGVYIPGWGGVRIEDMVLVTDRGGEILTKGSKEMTLI